MKPNKTQILPHSDEMEMACLGSILVKGNEMFLVVKSVLKPHHFYQEKHKSIFQEMIKLNAKNSPIDNATLIDSLRNGDLIKKCDGAYYITKLRDATPTPSMGKYYAEQVFKYYIKRQKIEFGQKLAKGEDVDYNELKTFLESNINNKSILVTEKPMEFYEIVNDDTEKPNDFIEGYLPIESIAMDVGIHGIGKTLFNLNKAICLSNGSSWFGLKILNAVKVLYFIAEGGYYSIQSRIKTMAQNMDILPKVGFLTIAPIKPFNITDSSHFQMIESEIDKISPDVIFFDPLVKIHNSDENSNNEMEEVMNKLRSLITNKNRSIIIVHHTNKGGDSRGASAIEGDVDSSLQISWMKNAKGIREIKFTKMRHQEIPKPFHIELEPSILWFNQVDSNNHFCENKVIEIVKESRMEGILSKDLVDILAKEFNVGGKTPYRWINPLIENGVLKTDKKSRNKRLWLKDYND